MEDVGDEFTGEAARAASRISEVETASVELRSEAERAYDTAWDKVDRLLDQGRDMVAAWAEADPDGSIQRNFQLEEQRSDELRQNEINSTNAEAIRQATHAAKVAAIEQIGNPAEREAAMRELLAAEKAADARRGARA